MDREAIEHVLQMGEGYVLDFSDRTFAEFFADFGVDIDDATYRNGPTGSKGNRMREFLKLADVAVARPVLVELLERRLLKEPKGLKPELVERYRAITAAGVNDAASVAAQPAPQGGLAHLPLRASRFHELPMEPAVVATLVSRMEEAEACVRADAFLAATILCGSVLEGMCFGIGIRDPARVNRAFAAKYNKTAPPHRDWQLSQWIEVLAHLGDLSPNVEKYAHGLREFRNYVHPRENVASNFTPDARTVDIGFRVVLAALEDLLRATRPPST